MIFSLVFRKQEHLHRLRLSRISPRSLLQACNITNCFLDSFGFCFSDIRRTTGHGFEPFLRVSNQPLSRMALPFRHALKGFRWIGRVRGRHIACSLQSRPNRLMTPFEPMLCKGLWFLRAIFLARPKIVRSGLLRPDCPDMGGCICLKTSKQ